MRTFESTKKQETVFLSGTSEVKDLMFDLCNKLTKLGFNPLIYTSPTFPKYLNTDAMTNCLDVARESDRMIVVIDKNSGNLYKNQKTITEEEFDIADNRQIPRIVFVRKKVFYHLESYQKKCHSMQKAKLSTDEFNELFLDADKKVFEFLDRLYSKKNNGVAHT